MILSKILGEGREVNMINTVSKINLSKIVWEDGGVNLNLDNVFKYTVFVFFRVPLSNLYNTVLYDHPVSRRPDT